MKLVRRIFLIIIFNVPIIVFCQFNRNDTDVDLLTYTKSLKEAFITPDSVRKLYLVGVYLDDVKEFTYINKLTKLQSLILAVNNITTLPEGISHIDSLRYVSIEANSRLDFNDVFKKLSKNKNINSLKLGNNHIKILPSTISLFNNLIELDLSLNELTKLPNSICQLTKLKYLELGENNIDSLPVDLFKLEHLEEIGLYKNQSMDVHLLFKILSTLRSLKKLSLMRDNIVEIPIEIREFKSLEFLDLGFNNLKQLPEELFKLKKLQTLMLVGNQFTEQEIEYIRNKMPNCNVGWIKNK